MKKSIENLLSRLQQSDDGKLSGGFGSIRGGMNLDAAVANGTGCANDGTCSGSNASECSNTGDCTKSSNITGCSNELTCFA